jgi:hypothetical protein
MAPAHSLGAKLGELVEATLQVAPKRLGEVVGKVVEATLE